MEKIISLDGVQMRVTSSGGGGEVNAETLFNFVQDGSVVSAEYAGGRVRLGYLIWTIFADLLHFRYVQVNNEGRLDSGYSTCDVSQMADGRIRLVEHFNWDSRVGSGINIFEEIVVDRS